jgi:hypothetical protein
MPPAEAPPARTVRCAIYTRKSTEEGLSQCERMSICERSPQAKGESWLGGLLSRVFAASFSKEWLTACRHQRGMKRPRACPPNG